MERCQRQLWNPKNNTAIRLRIFTQLNTHDVGSVSSKKKKMNCGKPGLATAR